MRARTSQHLLQNETNAKTHAILKAFVDHTVHALGAAQAPRRFGQNEPTRGNRDARSIA